MPNPRRGGRPSVSGNHKTNNVVERKKKKKVKKRRQEEVRKADQTISKPRVTTPNKPKASVPKTNKPKANKPKTSTFKPTVTNTSNQLTAFNNSKLKDNILADQQKAKEKNKIDWSAAANKGANTTALGTQQKETETKLTSDKQQEKITKKKKKEYYKSDEWKDTKQKMKKANRKAYRDALKEMGATPDQIKSFMKSEEGKKLRKESYQEMKARVKKDINKSIKKDTKDTYNLKSVNALSKDEMLLMQNATRMGKKMGNKYLEANKKGLAKKIGSKTAESAYKGKAATGVMQGMSKVDVFSGVGKYDKASKEALRQTKESGAYNTGYVAGTLLDMAMGGVNAKGTSVAGAIAKGSTKKLGKELAETSGKRFLRNRAGELVAETPSNILDAAKMSTDENGKVDAKTFAKYLGLNTGLTAVGGGALEGIGAGATKYTSKRVAELLTKKNVGKLTKEETEELAKKIASLTKKANNDTGTVSGKIAKDSKKYIEDVVNENYITSAKKQMANAKQQIADRVAKETEKGLDDAYAKASGNVADVTKVQGEKRLLGVAEDTHATISKKLEDVQTAKKNAKTLEEYQTLSNQENILKKAYENSKEKLVGMGKNKADTMSLNDVTNRLDDIAREKRLIKERGGVQSKWNELVNEESALRDRLKAIKENGDVTAPKNAEGTITPNAVKNADTTADMPNKAIADNGADADGNVSTNVTTLEEQGKRNNEIKSQIDALEKEKIKLKSQLKNSKGEIAIAKANGATEGELDIIKARQQEMSRRIDEIKAQQGELAKQQKYNGGTDRWWKEESKASGLKDDDGWSGTPEQAKQRAEETRAEKGDAPKGEVEINTPVLNAPMKNAANIGEVMYKSAKAVDKFKDKVSRGFFNSFRNIDKVIASVDNTFERNRLFGLVQNARMSKSTAMSKVTSKLVPMYKEFGLNKDKKKFKEFEEYCFLKHHEERLIKDDTGFMANKDGSMLSLMDTRKRIEELEIKYGKSADSDVINENGQLQQFQKRMTEYFNDLLDEDVRCGFDTKANVDALKKKWEFYVPTYRDVDDIANYPPSNTIHFGGVHKAVGGTEKPVMGLLDQAIEKSTATMKRASVNDLMNALANLNGVRLKDMPRNVMPDEALQASTFTFKGQGKEEGKYYVQFWQNGEEKALEVNEGIYKGIRQWNGQDKLFFMNLKLTPIRKINTFFKAWITDYSLVFGARNFIRDMETALFYTPHPAHFARNIPRGIACVLADGKVGNIVSKLSPKMKEYVDTYAPITQAYKENGGTFSQLVTSTNPEKAIKQMCQSKNGPLTLIRDINSMLETIPRMTEFCATVEESAMKNADNWNKLSHTERRNIMSATTQDKGVITDAMYRAKEVTLNFDRSGYIGRWLNSGFVPFFNPAVQGLSKLGRTLSKNGKTGTEFMKMLAMFSIVGGGTEALWQGTIGQMEEYQNISDYNKTGYFCLPATIFNNLPGLDHKFAKTDFFKIPKAREVAALTGPIQWAFQHMVFHCAGKDENLFHSLLDVDINALDSSKSLSDRILHPVSTSGNIKTWWEQIGPVSPLSDNILYAPFRIAEGKNWYGGYIESFDDEDLVANGESYKAYDENTSMFSIGISKALNEGSDKLADFLGLDKSQRLALKQKVWSPKKLDDLFDSYLGGIYDMTIKQTSLKNRQFLDVTDSIKDGDAKGFGKNVFTLLGSPFGNAFMLDTVLSNRHKQDSYQRKSDLQEDIAKLTKGIELKDADGKSLPASEVVKALGEKYGYDSPKVSDYLKKNEELSRLNNSFLYTGSQYDEMMAGIYQNDKLTAKQKKYWIKQIKTQQNDLLSARRDGKKFANADPMKWAYEATRQNGKKLYSADEVVRMCSYEFSNGTNVIGDAYKKYVKGGGNKNTFIKATLDMREVQRATGDSITFPSWGVAAYVIADREGKGKSTKGLADAYGVYDSAVEEARKYFTEGGGTMETFKSSHRQVVQGAMKLGKYVNNLDSWEIVNAMASYTTKGKGKIKDRGYYAEGYYPLVTMNAGRCLFSDKYKKNWTPEKIAMFCTKNGFTYKKDKDGNVNKPDPEKVASAISKEYGKYSLEEQAAVFEEICPYEDNPFGSIGDYSVKGDTGIQYSGRGYGHGRRRHRRYGHGHGRSGKSSFTPATMNMSKLKVHDYTFKSTLNDAYRKALKKRTNSMYKS